MEPGSSQWYSVNGPETMDTNFFFVCVCKGGQTLEQVAQTGCGVSIHRNIQNPTGQLSWTTSSSQTCFQQWGLD